MAFRQEDFKKTSRKSTGDAPDSLYPHQLKDKKTLARLEVAIRTFDTSVGKRRGDMDAGAMTDFFGDPRLARGVVACLGQFYKYETPSFAQAVGQGAATRLREAGLGRPTDIRALTYAVVNEQHGGFLTESARAACYEALGARFCLSAQQWNNLMHADAEDNQVLTRLGAVPTPADIRALYNFHSLDTVLRRSSKIVLTGLSLTLTDAADVRGLGKALGLHATVAGEGGTVTLGEGEPCRAGSLARAFLHLTHAYGTRSAAGSVDAKIGPRAFRLQLATDALRVLGMPLKPPTEKPQFRRRFEAGAALHKDLLKLRVKGQANGWRIKRLPEPIVSATEVRLPDFTLTRAAVILPVILAPPAPNPGATAPGGATTPAGGAGREMASAFTPPELGAGGSLTLALGRKPLDAAALLARAEAEAGSLFAQPPAAAPAIPGDVRALCDRAAREGLVRSADARRALHLLDDSPLIAWVRQCADPRVRFVPGVGLCSQEMVAAIQGVAG